ncbi:PREDICTED: protein TIC 22-like, chloroplastic [Nicotiana attenuata]|uniref:Protein tic 22-like, chloroplastic n=1 Tax=Nicotiana attenuata TaxID=49451 RepID=A0A1J6I719_NICAT|nr:PREDICTED: protein TIC 22-like, chloroplastic [Nicotiana attenuata]OIT00244.1 protein tic 22-like, chloroplastic [Nicotiana attenuata]
MNIFKPKQSSSSSSSATPPHLQLQQTFKNLQTHFSNFLQTTFPQLNTLNSYQNSQNPWAKIGVTNNNSVKKQSLSTEAIEERLAGVPVYALSNASEEFVLVSGVSTGKNLGLFCFSEADAEALRQQMESMDPTMRNGSRVVPVALNKVFQLKVDGVAFRLIPEASQVKNAIKERERTGTSDESFYGVPVFQSRSLILRSQNKRYRPVFFRKEDLENSLLRASQQQGRLNPALKGDIQVAVLEDIIQGMKDTSTSKWDDVVFVPPGFDVSTDPSQK